MKTVNRGLLALFSFLSIFVYAAVILLLIGWKLPVDYLNSVLAQSDQTLILIAIAVLMLLMSIVLLLMSFRRGNVSNQAAVVEDNSMGAVSVTVAAVENLVNRIVLQMAGVRDVKQRISIEENGVAIKLHATVSPDVIIPETAQQMQKLVSEGVAKVTGLNVNKVAVSIEDIAAAAKPVKTTRTRVE